MGNIIYLIRLFCNIIAKSVLTFIRNIDVVFADQSRTFVSTPVICPSLFLLFPGSLLRISPDPQGFLGSRFKERFVLQRTCYLQARNESSREYKIVSVVEGTVIVLPTSSSKRIKTVIFFSPDVFTWQPAHIIGVRQT